MASQNYCEECGRIKKASPIESGKKALEKTRSVRKDIDNLLSIISNVKDDDISDAFRFVKTAKQLSAEMSRADTLIQNRIREAEHRSR